MRTTDCVVIGGGPAGMVLGLLLARAGVEVTVVEKHGDFLRDFRGDTVHASTLRLLDELGLGPAFEAVPHRLVERFQLLTDSGPVVLADLRRLPGPHKHIAFVPQWDFLDMLAASASREPTFELRMSTEAVGLVRRGRQVTGVRVREADGRVREIAARLVVGCDGRDSRLREQAGLRARSFGVPLDVLWFRLPRRPGDVEGATGRFGRGRAMVLIDRGDYFQCAFLIRKGEHDRVLAEGLPAFRGRVSDLLPWLADRMDSLTSLEEVRLLSVRLDRLRTWEAPGVLFIGDAAHAMSPVGGVGINLAVQDAVAAARYLAAPLLTGRPRTADLRRVRRRRWLPTAVTQGMQRALHAGFLQDALDSDPRAPSTPPPLLVRALRRFPLLRAVPAYLVAVGLVPEHAPPFARRSPARRDGAVDRTATRPVNGRRPGWSVFRFPRR
ncbi:FAD-dependent oxidoreductase [Actinoalloteichus sp. AHMU CJ021]|uniref:2-polyprenyl-6-methoxyphenol hydroxylase n=1 Tax=Actinoalloteichus caeruleus DSM 43889 TaxID=1120930 RepID=A0ABT1JHS9_ACTCY|nr:FAD-dependent oxidoreductase [Actinoalloteichus caeruleus]AUS78071.1 FAD-dependent oxidoreductase [Actinoalloteichus sp. AHMU CJ021]MCP2332064.1 2-polyprenyl-6-methoxyphenol hydroxylase [Actinoalloteichus caeruleus DSM 43889]